MYSNMVFAIYCALTAIVLPDNQDLLINIFTRTLVMWSIFQREKIYRLYSSKHFVIHLGTHHSDCLLQKGLRY